MTRHGTRFRFRGWALGLAVLCPLIAADPAAAAPPDLPQVGQAEFPDDDAIILRHHQAWTLNDDGSSTYEEHRFVKLLSDRAWGRYADPRVDYLDGAEQVELPAARTYLPDGSIMDIPKYSTTVVSPDDICKWPTFANWRQMIYIFSGVQNGAILELHYKRTSQPGARRWLEADLRLGDLDPVVERVVEVTVPGGAEALQFDCSPKEVAEFKTAGDKSKKRGGVTYRWTMRNLAADPDEASCPPWPQRCGRLRFTNCPSAQEWATDILRSIESSAEATESIREFARDAAGDKVDEAGKARAIAKKLRDTFNFVDDPRGWVGRHVRPVGEVFDSCYGSRLEGAALLLAALRAAGLEAVPRLAVVRDAFSEKVATDSALAAVAIEVAAPTGTVWLEPSSGVINPNGEWRDRDLLYLDGGKLQRLAAFASASSQPDTVLVRGLVKLDEKAEKLTGEINIELTGLFVDAEKLQEDKERKARIAAVVSGILPGLEVSDSSVSHLSSDRFVARATVQSKEPPKQVYNGRLIALAAATPALAEGHLPLDRSKRRTPIQLPGQLSEDLRITIEWPDGWKPALVPESLQAVQGDWGRLVQTVEVEGKQVRVVRQANFNVRTIAPADFATVREAVRTLQSNACRTLLLEPAGS